MEKIIKAFFLLCLISSCQNKTETSVLYNNGNVHFVKYFNNDKHVKTKEFYETGELKAIYEFENSKRNSRYYEKSGRLLSVVDWQPNFKCVETRYFKDSLITYKGKVNIKGQRINWWTAYNKDGHLQQKQEYKIIQGKEYVNQCINYNSNGKIDDKTSYYFEIKLPDTLKIGRSVGDVYYNSFFVNANLITICIGDDLKHDYSNIAQTKIDTFYSKDKNLKWFGVEFKKPGKKTIRGFVNRQYFETKNQIDAKTNDTQIIIHSQNFYFEKEVFIKP